MKKQQILFASALALTLALGACTNDNEPQVVDLTKPISLDFGLEATTKVAIENPIGFDNGDAVGVYLATSDDQTQAAINAGQPVNNVQFQLNGGTWDGVIYWQNTAQWHTLYAYYPYDAALDGTQTTKAVSVQADQYSNNGQAYKAADYLWGVNRPVMATVSSQIIQLKHRMARIVVKLSCGDDMAPEELQAIAPSLKLLGTDIPTQGTFEVKDGSITADPSQDATTLSEVTPYSTRTADGSGAYTYYAILLPGTQFANGAEFVSLTDTDGTPYIYKLNAGGNDLQLVAGNEYTFKLKANKAGIDLAQFTIESWTNNNVDESGSADMVVD